MITQKETASAIGGKTARACESCLIKRARWFCPADDAFLCQACDSLVHSANELAARHTRVRMATASFKPITNSNTDNCNSHSHKSICTGTPSWHQGFTKKARTPRHGAKRAKLAREKHTTLNTQMMPVVPEMSGDEGSTEEENEEQMMFSVPTFEPFEVELENTINYSEVNDVSLQLEDGDFNISLIGFEVEGLDDWNDFPEFHPSDNNLVEFAADVESLLLEQVPDEDDMYTTLSLTDKVNTDKTFSMKNIENLHVGDVNEDIKVKGEEEEHDGTHLAGGCSPGKWEMKVEEETERTTDCAYFDWPIDVPNDQILNFENNYCHPQVMDVETEKKEEKTTMTAEMEETKKMKTFLSLNYEGVINAWAGSSPWTTGRQTDFNFEHNGWPECMGALYPLRAFHQDVEILREKGNMDKENRDREARVSRYRKKREMRLFSKKIRYEVRKLNAQKRPRLKGRFVKRISITPT